MNFKNIENLVFMAVCSCGSEGYILSILQDSTFDYIINEIMERWKHICPTMIEIKFYILKLIVDKDVRNIYEIHLKLKAMIIEMVVSHYVSSTESPKVVINKR